MLCDCVTVWNVWQVDKRWRRCAGFRNNRLGVFVFLVHLFGHEMGVEAIIAQELSMRALLNDLTVVKHDYLVRILDRAQSVSNDQDRVAFQVSVNGLLDLEEENEPSFSGSVETSSSGKGAMRLTKYSDSASSALVASSSNRIVGFLIKARAMAIRCFWPPDNWVPLSPHSVSYCDGVSMMKL